MSLNRRAVVHGLVSTPLALGLGCGKDTATDSGAADGTDKTDGTDGTDGTTAPDGTDGTDGTDGVVDNCETASDVEGPYYTPDAPTVAALADDDEPGTRILITGTLVDAGDCITPRSGWTIDLWHADDAGEYDNTGFNLRGKVVTGADGGFVVETILPGQYDGRPVRHIHFKVWSAEGTAVLTSQIYFPGPDHDPERHPGPLVPLTDGAGTVLLAV